MMIMAAYYASPQRLTHVLVDAMTDVKKKYLEAVENGALCDADTAAKFSKCAIPSFRYFVLVLISNCVAYSSRYLPSARRPSAALSRIMQCCATSSNAARSPSCAASIRFASSRPTSRYVNSSLFVLCSPN
jgi:hypothetical protein